jgi:surfactin synthase thioesterase subunit
VSTGALGRTAGLVRPRPVADPQVRLFLLHHAGGSHTAFRGWAGRFPPSWDVCGLDAPGRGSAAAVPPLSTVDELVEHLLCRMEPWLDRPYAVFGHSMGALVAFALALRAGASGRPLPCWLGLSAHPGPRTAEAPPREHLHRLPPAQLRLALAHLGGAPAAAALDEAVWAQREPLTRTDLVLAETWRPGPGPLVVPVPVSAFCGVDDPVGDVATAARWAAHTRYFLGVRAFPGGHFYFRTHPGPVVDQIVADVSSVAPAGCRPPQPRRPAAS